MAEISKRRLSTIERWIKDLQNRVAHLERPVRTKRQQRADQKFWADYERRSAEADKRSKAMRDYWNKEREERLRANPNQLRIAIEGDRSINEFLKSKGLEQDVNTVPPALRRKAKRLTGATSPPPSGALSILWSAGERPGRNDD